MFGDSSERHVCEGERIVMLTLAGEIHFGERHNTIWVVVETLGGLPQKIGYCFRRGACAKVNYRLDIGCRQLK